jgi:hypothetical protein
MVKITINIREIIIYYLIMDHLMNLRNTRSEDDLQYKGGSFTPQPRKKSIHENIIEMQMNSAFKKRKTKIKILGVKELYK